MASLPMQLPTWEFSKNSNENYENFKLFKQSWDNFELIAFDNDTDEKIKIAYLESALSQNKESIQFYNKIEFTVDQKKLVKSRIEVIENKVKVTKVPRYERLAFKSMKQEEGESVEEFANKLKAAIKDCDFQQDEKTNLNDQFIFGLREERLQRDLLRKGEFEIDTVIQEIKLDDLITKRLEEVKIKTEPEDVINKVQTVLINCKFCGRRHEKVKEKCPAWGKECKNCGKKNHFARMCLSREDRQSGRRNTRQRRNIRFLQDQSEDEEDEEEICGLEELEDVRLVKKKSKMLRGDLKVITKYGKHIKMRMIIDTGATCCVMGSEDLKKLFKKPRINRSNVRLKCFSGQIVKAIGSTTLEMESEGIRKKILFQVIEGEQEPILSCEASQDMGFITVNKIFAMSTENSQGKKQLREILRKYKNIFVGDGKMKSEASLEVDGSVCPVQEKARRIPVGIRHRLEKELVDLTNRNLVEKVDHPVKWTSNIVVVKKKNKDQIRICLDPKYVNEALVRKKYQIPTIEEVLPELAQAKVFSLLDCKNGFLQVPLQESSRDLTAFWTPFGIYRWKVLPFGISCAPEIFQKKQCEIVQGLKGVEVIADDILVYGVGDDFESALLDHNRKLEKLLERLVENGVKLNKEKAQIAKTSLNFYGHTLTSKGVLPDKWKTDAIVKAERPKDLKDLECFLGMIAYHQKFIPNLSAINEPLRTMLKSKEFVWNQEAQEAFVKLKAAVANCPVLKYFDVNKPVVLQTDASRKGLGGVLLQEDYPVIYVSKALTTTEQKYAIIELELLAILFTCKRLDQYISGKSNIVVESDHLPLKGIFNKPIHQCSKRIQRMRLELLKYDIKVRYKPGKELVIADYLSRNPVSAAESEFDEEENVLTVLSKIEKINLMKDQIIEDENIKEIRRINKTDNEMQILINAVISKDWETIPENMRTFRTYKEEISVQDGLVFKEDRIVIPRSLRKKYLCLLHIGHPGTEAAILKARKSVFWPGINNDIKNKTENCHTCTVFKPEQQKMPMLSHRVPSHPFEIVSMDFCECQYEGQKRNILVVVDHFSDYIEFSFMKGTASRDVIVALKTIFARQGVPRELLSDGAHNLSSQELKKFAMEWGFELVNSSPYYPRGNGKAEAAVKVLKTLIKKTQKSGECLYEAVLEHRNTRNKIGYSPVERLMGRSTRGRLPTVVTDLQTKAKPDVAQRIERKRATTKRYYDKGTRNLKDLNEGDSVVVKMRPGNKEWTPGKITNKFPFRKYEVEINGKKFIRNRQLIAPNKTQNYGDVGQNSLNQDTDSCDNQHHQTRDDSAISHNQTQRSQNRRSIDIEPEFTGFQQSNNAASSETRVRRTIQRPAYLRDYVTY